MFKTTESQIPTWCSEIAEEFAVERPTISLLNQNKSKTPSMIWRNPLFADKVEFPNQHFFFPNDRNFFAALRSIPSANIVDQVPPNNRVMLVVGNSYLLSALPMLIQKSGTNIVLLCDKDPLLIKFMQYLRTTFLASQTEAEFLEKLGSADNSVFKYLGAFILEQYKIHEKKELGEDHCFYSEENFTRCRNALQSAIFVPVCIDLFDAVQVNKLANLICGKISLMNLTNLQEWDGYDNLSTTLKILPTVDKPIILSSSFRDSFGYRGFGDHSDPKTRAMVCSVDDYTKTYLEKILLHIFIRYGANDEKLAGEVLQGVNHVNTPGIGGYTPLEVAALQFQDVNLVRLLLKYGAKITANLVGKLEPEIKQYFLAIVKHEVDLQFSYADIAETEALIKDSLATKGLRVLAGTTDTYQAITPGVNEEKGYYFSEIGENSLVFAAGNTHIGRLRKNASIVVTNGNLIVENSEECTHLQTNAGNILLQSLQGQFIRIISSNDVELAQNHSEEIHIIAGGAIKAQNIGPNSSILARKTIQAGNVARDAVLLSRGNIHINNADYGVTLATANADLSINYDPPHGGMLSIQNTGTAHYHLQGKNISGSAVELNTSGKAIDHSPTTLCYVTTGKFFEQRGSFDINKHGSLILNMGLKFITWLQQRPIYENASKTMLSQQKLYISILEILGYTPCDFLEMYQRPPLDTVVQGLPPQVCNPYTYFEEVVVGTAIKMWQAQKEASALTTETRQNKP